MQVVLQEAKAQLLQPKEQEKGREEAQKAIAKPAPKVSPPSPPPQAIAISELGVPVLQLREQAPRPVSRGRAEVSPQALPPLLQDPRQGQPPGPVQPPA